MTRRRGTLQGFKGFSKNSKNLITMGVVNQLGLALYNFILVLYIPVLGHDVVLFGALAAVSEFSSVAVLTGSGFLSDKIGRRRVLIIGLSNIALGLLILAFLSQVAILFVATFFIGIGTGFIGPAFAAMLADQTVTKRRKYLFSLNSIVSQVGSGCIIFIGGFIPWLFMTQMDYETTLAYRMVFLIGAMLVLTSLVIMWRLRDYYFEEHADPKTGVVSHGPRPWRLLFKFAFPVAITGFGAGMLVPYLPLYFAEEWGLDLGNIGVIFAFLMFTMASMTVFLPRIAEKRGSVVLTTVFNLVSICALIMIPFSPWLVLVVVLFVVRQAMMNVPGPIATAFMHSKVPEDCRGTAQSTHAFAWQITHAIGLVIGGYIWVWDVTNKVPFYLTTGFYLASVIIYLGFFYKMDDKKHKHWHRKPFFTKHL